MNKSPGMVLIASLNLQVTTLTEQMKAINENIENNQPQLNDKIVGIQQLQDNQKQISDNGILKRSRYQAL